MKKALALALSLLLSLGLLAACGGEEGTPEPASEPVESAAPEASEATPSGEVFEIGILQYVEHAALDAAYEGFVDALAEAGYVDGENINIEYQNASGDQSNTNTIAGKFVNDGKDLVYAIATPAAQALVNSTSDIPILISAVTDPVDSQLVASMDASGNNVTGTSDLTPIRDQIELLTQLFPEAKTVGVLFDSSEDNSRVQMELTQAACDEFGLTAKEYTVSSSNDVQQVVQSMVGNVDVLYAFTDNTIANAMATVAQIANENNLPTIVGEEGMVEAGGLASYSISYYEIGRITGQMAVQVLEGADPGSIPLRYQDSGLTFVYNEETAATLNVEIPEDLK